MVLRLCLRLFEHNRRTLLAVVCSSAMMSLANAQQDSQAIPADQLRFFEERIRPALVEHCYRCHSNEGSAVRGGLAVDSREGLRGGGQSGPAVVPGNLDDCTLWTAINHFDFEMPPNRMMPKETIADFRQWILMGAPDPRQGVVGQIHSTVTPADIEAGREFWAFTAPISHPVPAAAGAGWAWNICRPFQYTCTSARTTLRPPPHC